MRITFPIEPKPFNQLPLEYAFPMGTTNSKPLPQSKPKIQKLHNYLSCICGFATLEYFSAHRRDLTWLSQPPLSAIPRPVLPYCGLAEFLFKEEVQRVDS